MCLVGRLTLLRPAAAAVTRYFRPPWEMWTNQLALRNPRRPLRVIAVALACPCCCNSTTRSECHFNERYHLQWRRMTPITFRSVGYIPTFGTNKTFRFPVPTMTMGSSKPTCDDLHCSSKDTAASRAPSAMSKVLVNLTPVHGYIKTSAWIT